MSKTRPLKIDCDRQHPCLAVPDIRAAIDFYTRKLGFSEAFTVGEPPTFAGLNLDKVQIFLAPGNVNTAGCSVCFVVGNADDLFAFHEANGVKIVEPIKDRDYGLRDYAVTDLNGYRLSFGHYIYTQGEPVPIERVDLPVRIEKRLAGLLQELAAYKRMSLASCLEEILLHTCEPCGDGVASPHTTADLRYIQELKKKHGIAYDCHASYRFVERGDSVKKVGAGEGG